MKCLECYKLRQKKVGARCKPCNNSRYRINKEQILKIVNVARIRLKELIFSHYGKMCACCGEDNFMLLTIDHIEGNGKEHRKEVSSGTAFWYWIKRNNFPVDFQTLCYNCNIGRYRNGGICPHRNKE